MGERNARYGKRVALRIDDTSVCVLPWQWTDLAGLDPEIVLGGGRSFVRVRDLIELERLLRARADGGSREV